MDFSPLTKGKTTKKVELFSFAWFGMMRKIKKFVENLKLAIKFKDLKNIREEHLKIINDYTNGNLYLKTSNKKGRHKNSKTLMHSSMWKFKGKLNNFGNNFLTFYRLRIIISLKKVYTVYNKYIKIINPDSKFIFYWNFLCMLLTFFFFIIFPLEISFIKTVLVGEEYQSYFETIYAYHYLSSLFFLLDIVLRVHCGYYNKFGDKVVSRRKIVIQYIKDSLLCDALSLFPFFLQLVDNSKTISYLNLFFLFKYFHLNKLIQSMEEKLSFNDYTEGLFLLIKLIIKIIYVAHIIACSFHVIGSFSLENLRKSWLDLIHNEDGTVLSQWKYRSIF